MRLLTMLERVAIDVVQGIAMGQLCGSQSLELLRCHMQFELGNKGLSHRTNVRYFTEIVNRQESML